MTELPHADQVRNHARWRPGWHSGRTSYAWLLPFADQPGLRHLVNQYQYAMRDLPVGTAYAVWVGIGASLTVAYAMATGAEPVSLVKIVLVLGIIGCVAGLKYIH